ncbi:hypothetical protein LOY41_12035 [Pseudomonas atacamensis]|uniref:hypothetical protein n=1 Tax=Pseudomonas atacamensis TaxID=2565368 RepID=UPI00215E737D|nr:hypothetical protein [Pseudomonas atacamensis]UVM01981.1 hypothetical protein LOY41_12035 [Pseudomonas atacamensis]
MTGGGNLVWVGVLRAIDKRLDNRDFMIELQSKIDSILPVSVLAAVVLFIVKEVVEFFKRSSERKRKISAYKILLCEELQKNLWTLNYLTSICHAINDEHFTGISYRRTSSGSEQIVVHVGREGEYGPLWNVYTSIFDKAVVDLAVIDKKLFEKSKVTYECLAEAGHIRNSIIRISEDKLLEEYVESFPEYALNVLKEAVTALDVLYIECAGKKLDRPKLRSYV